MRWESQRPKRTMMPILQDGDLMKTRTNQGNNLTPGPQVLADSLMPSTTLIPKCKMAKQSNKFESKKRYRDAECALAHDMTYKRIEEAANAISATRDD